MPRPARIAALSCLLSAVAVGETRSQDDDADLAAFYGFDPLVILKVEDRSEGLHAADLNGDGIADLVVEDDSHSRLDLFLRRETPAEEDEPTRVNDLPETGLYEHVKFPVDREIGGLVPGDFNGDGRLDIAAVGLPDRLIVYLGPEGGDWSRAGEVETRELRLPDLNETAHMLDAGDLNGDGRADLAVLGTEKTYLLLQTADGTFGPADELRNTSNNLSLLLVGDLDGDGRDDLSYTTEVGGERVFAARLQQPGRSRVDEKGVDGEEVAGELGPELQFDLNQPRSITLADVDGEPGDEVLSVTGGTGRLTVRKVERPAVAVGEERAAIPARLTQYGFGGAGGDRDLAVGDVDGDGGLDVVVTDPDQAQVIVFRRTGPGAKEAGDDDAVGGPDLGTAYPGLLGAGQVRIADLDGDGAGEVVTLSEEEGTLGVARFADGRLTFPRPLGIEVQDGKLVAFDVAPFGGGPPDSGEGEPHLFAISETRSGRNVSYTLGVHPLAGGEAGAPLRLGGEEPGFTLADVRGKPVRLEVTDLDGDGTPEAVLFPGRGRDLTVVAFRFEGDAVTAAVVPDRGIGPGEVEPGAFSVGTLTGEDGAPQVALLAARGNFARDLTYAGPGSAGGGTTWTVADQYNAPGSGAKIEGAATLDLDGKPGEEVVLVDTGVDKLRVLAREGSLYVPLAEVDTGDFPYRDTRVADLDGDGRDDLLLVGDGRFAVLYAGRTDPRLEEVAGYESDLDDTYFADSVAGDLNGDGEADVAFLDVRSHFVELLKMPEATADTAADDPESDGDAAEIRRATYWKLFEEKNFSGDGGGGLQPREGLIADVTGDGRADLVLLVHDRVLIYPQDDGVAENAEPTP